MIDSPIPPSQRKSNKYDPSCIHKNMMAWKVEPLYHHHIIWSSSETIIEVLEKLQIHPREVRKLMKHIHQITIKYLTYLVLNKRKLNNNQAPVDP
jgi:hypothetical protein